MDEMIKIRHQKIMNIVFRHIYKIHLESIVPYLSFEIFPSLTQEFFCNILKLTFISDFE